jgi:selenophosphate synthetase-related protein
MTGTGAEEGGAMILRGSSGAGAPTPSFPTAGGTAAFKSAAKTSNGLSLMTIGLKQLVHFDLHYYRTVSYCCVVDVFKGN